MPTWIVLTPMLATTDQVHLERYVEQYAKQKKIDFTVIIYPNASLAVDPKQRAVAKAVRKIKRLQKAYPHLDLRYVTDPKPDQKFTSIGALRRRLWDAATVAYSRSDSLFPKTLDLLQPEGREERGYSPEELVALVGRLFQEPFFFNHDVDLVALKDNYLFEFAWQATALYFFSEKENLPRAFGSRAVHGRCEGFPHANAVVAFYDYLVSSVRSSFEASLAIPGHTYTALGGFSTDAYTYEVAGFVPRDSTVYISHLTLVTDQRRFNSKLHHTSITLLWGKHGEPELEDFNETDICRREQAGDITAQRRDELILERNRDAPISSYLMRAVSDDVYIDSTDEDLATYRLFTHGKTEEEFHAGWDYWIQAIHRAMERRLTVLGRILRLGDFGGTEELLATVREEMLKELEFTRESLLSELREEMAAEELSA